MGAGAWPFLVGGVICLVKSDNERDLILLNSSVNKEVAGGVGLARLHQGFHSFVGIFCTS